MNGRIPPSRDHYRLGIECSLAGKVINQRAAQFAAEVAVWEPAPMPPDWQPEPVSVTERPPRMLVPYLDTLDRPRPWFR